MLLAPKLWVLFIEIWLVSFKLVVYINLYINFVYYQWGCIQMYRPFFLFPLHHSACISKYILKLIKNFSKHFDKRCLKLMDRYLVC